MSANASRSTAATPAATPATSRPAASAITPATSAAAGPSGPPQPRCVSHRGGRYVSIGNRATPLPPRVESSKSVSQDTEEENKAPAVPLRAPDSPDEHRATQQFLLMSPRAADYNNDILSSNVLAWLQSPTANSLFSPGGWSSANTPKFAHPTPMTPTVSTSFFFSDVASLRDSNKDSSNVTGNTNKSSICISPLASKQGNQYHKSPLMDSMLKDVFKSPEQQRKFETALGGRGLDAVLAANDVNEDEELSVLLQMVAANQTPKRKVDSLQLPVINEASAAAAKQLHPKLKKRKTSNEDEDEAAFTPPAIAMRKTENSKAIFISKKAPPPQATYPYGSMRVTVNSKPKKETPVPVPPISTITPCESTGQTPKPPASQQQQQKQTQSQQQTPQQPPTHPGYHPHAAYYQYWGYAIPPYYGMYQHPPPPLLPQGDANNKASTTSTPVNGNSKPGSPVGAKPTPVKVEPETTPTGATHVSITPGKSDGVVQKRKNSPKKTKQKSPPPTAAELKKAAETIQGIAAGKNDKAAALAAAILRGVTMRPSGKWQAQLYFCGKSRYIGVFDSREKAALAYEIAREKLKKIPGQTDLASIERQVNDARKAAFDGVNEKFRN